MFGRSRAAKLGPLAVLACCAGSACSSSNTRSGAAQGAGSELLPCNVAAVLEQNCLQCHNSTTRLGAPISLVTPADFARVIGGRKVGAIVLERVTSSVRPMPPAPAAPLASPDVRALRNWINAGARSAADGCPVKTPGAPVASGDASVTPGDAVRSTQPGVVSGGWPMFGRDLANTRANLDELEISRDTVGTLEEAWRFTGPATSSTPAVSDGVVYLPGWDGKLYARSEADGSEIWTAKLPHLVDSSPALTRDRIYVSDGAGVVSALDRASGDVIWSQSVDDHPQVHLWSSPIVLADEGLVVVGVASYEEMVQKSALSFRGSVVALDAESGAERWRFYTTTADQAEGPGVAVWSSAAVDAARKALYVGTGNDYAPPSGPLEDSLLALDYVSGQKLWSTQFTSDDVFSIAQMNGPDWDIGSTANLFEAAGRELVGVGTKGGNYAAVDRGDGRVRWMTSLSPGGLFGGVIGAAAYANGAIFVGSNDASSNEFVAAALDAASGAIAWQRQFASQTLSSVACVDGVAFFGASDGTLRAIDSASGNTLWSDTLPDVVAGVAVADGMLLASYGYQLTIGENQTAGSGGLAVYRLRR